MKYFTPDLIERYGSDDPHIYKSAEAEWDSKCEEYSAYLRSVEGSLPAGLRIIEDNYHLHDAVICGMGQRHQTFVIMLQLDPAPHSLLTLTYDLLQEAVIKEGVLPPEMCTSNTRVEWQYDEIEQLGSEPPAWSHSVLLSNGWEVELRFRNVEVREVQAALPVPLESSQPVAVAARSA